MFPRLFLPWIASVTLQGICFHTLPANIQAPQLLSYIYSRKTMKRMLSALLFSLLISWLIYINLFPSGRSGWLVWGLSRRGCRRRVQGGAGRAACNNLRCTNNMKLFGRLSDISFILVHFISTYVRYKQSKERKAKVQSKINHAECRQISLPVSSSVICNL